MSRFGADDVGIAAVYGFLAYKLGSRAGAEQLTEAVFAHAIRDGGLGGDPASRLSLLRTAHRAAGGGSRHRRYWGSEPAVSVELADALETLGSRERSVVALRYGAGLAGPEIATVLGQDADGVRRLHSRGLRRLRVELEREQHGQGQDQDP